MTPSPLRAGIGRTEGRKETIGHVLGNFYGEEVQKLKAAMEAAVQAALLIIPKGVDEAMNKFNAFEA